MTSPGGFEGETPSRDIGCMRGLMASAFTESEGRVVKILTL